MSCVLYGLGMWAAVAAWRCDTYMDFFPHVMGDVFFNISMYLLYKCMYVCVPLKCYAILLWDIFLLCRKCARKDDEQNLWNARDDDDDDAHSRHIASNRFFIETVWNLINSSISLNRNDNYCAIFSFVYALWAKLFGNKRERPRTYTIAHGCGRAEQRVLYI